MPKFNRIKNAIKNHILKEAFYDFTHDKAFPKWALTADTDFRKKEILKDKSLLWRIGEEEGAAYDHIEMSGFNMSAIISYGKNKNGKLALNRHLVIPGIRVKPDMTTSHFRKNFKDAVRMFLEDTMIDDERPKEIKIRGNLAVESDFMNGAKVVRTFSPSQNFPALIEKIEVTNLSKDNAVFSASEKKYNLKILNSNSFINGPIEVCARLVDGSGDFRSNKKNDVEKLLVSGATAVCYIVYYAVKKGEVINFNAEREIKERRKLTDSMFKSPSVFTGDEAVDALFSHCLLRGSESIFETPSGLLHSPGGGRYYSAIWANDQCEYANPFFPYLGYKPAIEQALNCYRLYSGYILDGKCAPASLVAGGKKPYTVAGDRGDTEMFLYGLTRFLLALGDRETALGFLPALEKAAEFIVGKISADGVVYSDSDELEWRFPSGDYNLSTNCLAYDGFLHLSKLFSALGKDGNYYAKQAEKLKAAIITYFSGEVEGYKTYRYYKGNDILRSWICLPSIAGITESAEGTYDALFSDKMFDGTALKTASDTEVVWDRALLYALRGAFIVNRPDALITLKRYSESRLLGAHSPYPYEAYPEGNRAHLSAESVLFARIITEGIFGLEPLSFTELKIECNHNFKLSGINFGGYTFEIDNTDKLKIKIGSRVYPAEQGNIFDFAELKWK